MRVLLAGIGVVIITYFKKRDAEKKCVMKRIMSLLLVVLVLIVTPLCSCLEAYGLTYKIHPLVYHNGYELTGGTITTDGTLGRILPGNIVSYTASVTGPYSFTFDSSSSSSLIALVGNIEATPTEIVVPVRQMSPPISSFLYLSDSNPELPGCPNCETRQIWDTISSDSSKVGFWCLMQTAIS